MSDAGPEPAVRVKLIADLRRYLPAGAQDGVCTVSIRPGATIHDVLDGLGLPRLDDYVILRNGRDARPDELVQDGDQIAAFPRLAGG